MVPVKAVNGSRGFKHLINNCPNKEKIEISKDKGKGKEKQQQIQEEVVQTLSLKSSATICTRDSNTFPPKIMTF